MQLNALHMRVAAIASGVVLMVAFTLCGGSWGDEMIVQIDFSMEPDLFEGVDVEIDGEIVGQLETFGQAHRSGFAVGTGPHSICLRHPEFDCQPVELTLDKPGQKARLLADFASAYDKATGQSRPTIYLQY